MSPPRPLIIMGGTCSCDAKEEPNEVSVSVQPSKETVKKESQAPASAITSETQRAVEGTLEVPSEPEPVSKWTPADILAAQNAFRSYLTRRQQEAEVKTVVVMPPIPVHLEVEEEDKDAEELTEIPDLLSKEAKQKLEESPAFEYNLKVAAGHLRGPVKLKDGSVYVGQWLQGRRNGKGRLYTADGGLMEGYWNGLLHLKGREIHSTGDMYEGGYSEGKKQGFGLFEDLSKKNSYEGEWMGDKKHGRGIEHIEDGSVFEGNFANDQKSGNGVFKWATGEVFEGEFRDNVIHGRGKYVWKADTKWYDGEWQDGKMHGKGKFINEGKEYEGDFEADKKHGQGVYKWDGNMYEGDFADNKMHGKGYLTMKGKERKMYAFENNKRGAVIAEPAAPTS
jgi:hypothetical protein